MVGQVGFNSMKFVVTEYQIWRKASVEFQYFSMKASVGFLSIAMIYWYILNFGFCLDLTVCHGEAHYLLYSIYL